MLRLVLKTLLVLVIILLSVMYWLVGTESGFKTLVEQSQKWLPELQIEVAGGHIANELRLNGIHYQADANTLVSIEHVVLNWQPLDLLSGKLNIGLLSVDGVTIKQSGENKTKPESSESLSLPNIILPVTVNIEAIQINNVRLIDVDNVSTPLVKHFDASLALEKSLLIVNRLYVEHSDNEHIEFNGQVELAGLYSTKLNYKWAAVIPDFKAIAGNGSIDGDLAELNLKQQLLKPVQSSQIIVVHDVLDELSWQADIAIAKLNIADLATGQEGEVSDVKLTAKGDLNHANVDLTAQLTHPQLSTLTLTSHAQSADLEQWQVQSTIHSESAMAINVNGKISDVSTQPTMAIDVDWQNIQWPVVAETKTIISPQGRFKFDGNLAQFTLKLETAIEAQSQQATVTMDANGNDNKITLAQLTLNGFGGSARFAGQVLLDTVPKMEGELSINGINPGLVAADWPGSLSGGLNISALLSESASDIKVDDLDIHGQLRQRPVQLKGQLDYIDSSLKIPKIQLTSGQSLLSINGILNDDIAINWQLNSPDLADFYPGVSGQLNGDGTVMGKLRLPIYTATFSGQNIAYGKEVSIAKLVSDMKFDMSQKGTLQAQVALSNLAVESFTGINSQLNLSGTRAAHQLKLDIGNNQLDLSTLIEGGLDKEIWQGQLDKLNIKLTDSPIWQLTENNRIRVANKQLDLGENCLKSAQSEVCIAANYLQDNWQAHGSLSHFSLDMLHGLLEQLQPLSGDINGQFNIASKGGYPTSGQGQFSLDKGRIDLTKSSLDSKAVIDLTQAQLSYQLTENSTQALFSVQPKLDGVSTIKGSIATSDIASVISLPEKAVLNGHFDTAIDDLSVFDGLTSDYENLKGELKADISLTGTVKKPLVKGQVLIDKTSVDLSSAGISLTGIKAHAEGGLENGFKLSFQAQSGKGSINGSGDIIFTDKQWNVQSQIKGDHFEVINLPEFYATASPDIKMTLDANEMTVSGKLIIPEADIQPTQFNSSVSPSKDVVVVSNEPDQKDAAFPTKIDVEVILGEKINLTALGFKGRLTGNLLATGDASKQLLGKGQVVIKQGIYNAYGNELNIDDGKILFAGGPIDNPGLDIKAIKKAEKYQVGVHILGLADAPEIKLFSTPVMSDDEILAYLVLGKPLAEATVTDAALLASAAAGIGGGGGDGIAQKFGLDTLTIEGENKENASLEIGKNISNKLYVGYGIGIFDPVNTVNIRYKLNKIWSLRAESGQETGVDLLYTHER